ncbi:MAG: hypothetical protein AB7K52_01540 [Phycisphaerales bacterium]
MKKLAQMAVYAAAVSLLASGLAGCKAGSQTHYVEHDAQAQAGLLERLKPLAGTWEMVDEHGQRQTAIVSRVSSNGSVFAETMFPGHPHEMSNMYHMDGRGLVLTHYCAQGNQPRMRCVARTAPNVFVFAFDGGTNIARGQMYMGEMTLTIIDNNHIRQDWRSFTDGKLADHNASFDLVRAGS